MELYDAIRARRAVREYTDEMIDETTVRRLIDAAIQAPSANNMQPWAFVVIQDPALLRELSDLAKAKLVQQGGEGAAADNLRHLAADGEFNCFYNASTLVLICARRRGEHPEWDCCLAAENLMLAARDMGLGTCVIGLSWPVFADSAVRKQLAIPTGYRAVLPIIVGRPTSFPQNHGRTQPVILSWSRSQIAAKA